MFSRKGWGSGSGDEQFTAELSQLKRRGASVLVVGAVRTEQRQEVSRRLLGQTTSQPRRRVLVSTTGESHTMSHLADGDDAESATTALVNYETQSRGAAAANNDSQSMESVSVQSDDSPTTAATLADLGIAVSDAIEEFERDATSLAPGELRIAVDSLVPLLEEYGAERVFKFAHLTNGRTRDADGMIHYHLPLDRDSDVVSVLTPVFDIVIELRDRNGLFQERWTINDGDYSSGWLSIGQS
ncbi:hypothetical protein HTZ84_15515 [Haloterrigena sp. SYSU A558-1]|uniref:Uncharacterized protein n=1 Tax=Haloterrigena gelatinilytica TaxID=2741724 RepID=A0A8J8GJQ9_9EURY|nr:hypothetical protein [Haloterrigena gelatinilytica]NUB90495.1 hypothetical protein [Haloterrigena gelatinilytica]NUC73693.1 hypothetical protein [Haloterrigena gelatinilytica]